MARPYAAYTRLLDNSRSAVVAAVEICNKPTLKYREESFVILLVNAWELLLKAIIAKNKRSIFYPKKRSEPYKTLGIKHAALRAQPLLPASTAPAALLANVNQLVVFRDNAVHFYNQSDLSFLLYGLAQTALKNYNDVLKEVFKQSLGDELPGTLLPIGLEPPVDPISFLKRLKDTGGKKQSPVVADFIRQMQEEVARLEEQETDTSRFLTWYRVKLESTKKVQSADFVVGVESTGETLIVERFQDPNNFPFREKDILAKKLTVGTTPINQTAFRAIVWKYDIKKKPKYCWIATEGVLTKYSSEVMKLLGQLGEDEVKIAVHEYLAARRQVLRRTSATVQGDRTSTATESRR